MSLPPLPVKSRSGAVAPGLGSAQLLADPGVAEHARTDHTRKHTGHFVQGRLNSYRPKVGATDYRCPNCWIVDEKPGLLKSIPFERPDEDIMRCPTRGRDFGISLRV